MEMDYWEMFKALAVDTRVKIIDLLKTQGPMGAKKIGRVLGVTSAAASQHLKILKQAGLVRSERKGYWIPYAINAEALETYRRVLTEVCTCGCQGTGRWQEQDRVETSVEELERYELELENELRTIRARIKELNCAKVR